MSYLRQARTSRPSMGLETEGQCLFDGAVTTVTPAIVQGKVMHGLKNAADIKLVEDHYGHKFTDTDFYGALILEVPHTLVMLDKKKGEDLLKLGVLHNQGKLAPSVADQDDPNANYQFVEHDDDAVAEVEATLAMKRIKAMAKLGDIYEKEPKYLLALCHYLMNFNSGVRKPDAALRKLGEYIDGKITGEGKKNEAVNYFLNILDPVYGGTIPKEDIFITVAVHRAKSLHIIRFDTARDTYYNTAKPESEYGKRIEDVVDFLKAAQNADHLGGGAKDSDYAILFQIAKAEKTL